MCTTRRVDLADRGAVTAFAADLLAAPRAPSTSSSTTPAPSPGRRQRNIRPEDWDRVLDVNLSAQFMLTRAIGAAMLRRGSGKIIFTASLLSYQGGINVVAYTAAKSGIAGLVRALANEWAAHGVNVNAIVPGYIATDNTRALRADPQRSEAILQRIPAGRWGRPEDVAGAAVFLASAAADYVHGALVPVDGGWLGR